MTKTTKLLIIGVLTAASAVFAYLKIDRLLKSDACVDGGGRWNHEISDCEYEPIARPTEAANNVPMDSQADNDTLPELHGYNELANDEGRTHYPISEYNTDLEEVENIERPAQTLIVDPTIDTAQLFRIWTLNPVGPHADFWIKREHFYVVDYDGNGGMPYILKGDSITIFYNDFIEKGRIVKITKDSLTVWWDGIDQPTGYIEWRN
jgi:hypothetical protein